MWIEETNSTVERESSTFLYPQHPASPRRNSLPSVVFAETVPCLLRPKVQRMETLDNESHCRTPLIDAQHLNATGSTEDSSKNSTVSMKESEMSEQTEAWLPLPHAWRHIRLGCLTVWRLHL